MSRHGHRFFVSRSLSSGLTLSLDSTQSKQIIHVLRLREGDRIGLFNGDGRNYEAVIRSATRTAVEVDIAQSDSGPRLAFPPIWIAVALIKSERFEWALQKVTELGVERIFPMDSEQSVISLRVDRVERRLERWRRIVVEASEQSGRCTIPEVDAPVKFADVIAVGNECQPVLLWENEAATPLSAIEFDDRPILLIVGPEGGFSLEEVEAASATGIQTASLGPLTLRAETAAVAGVAMLVGRHLVARSSRSALR